MEWREYHSFAQDLSQWRALVIRHCNRRFHELQGTSQLRTYCPPKRVSPPPTSSSHDQNKISEVSLRCARWPVVTAELLKMQTFCDTTFGRWASRYRRFERSCYLHCQSAQYNTGNDSPKGTVQCTAESSVCSTFCTAQETQTVPQLALDLH
jgi:hypothetical protein